MVSHVPAGKIVYWIITVDEGIEIAKTKFEKRFGYQAEEVFVYGMNIYLGPVKDALIRTYPQERK